MAKCHNWFHPQLALLDIYQYLQQASEWYLPHVSVDITIIGFQEGTLKVLLLDSGEKWTLPGGYIGKEESMNDAAVRVLEDRTGLTGQYLKLFQVFGDKSRNFKEDIREMFRQQGFEWKEDLWINDRYISMAYYALVDLDQVHPTGGKMNQPHAWHDLNDLPPMWMDHAQIAQGALEQLKRDITIEQISFNLLPEEFTMPQLHRLHETILDKKLERSRFQKKMLALNLFERLPKLKEDVPHRKPYLYRIKDADDH
ncbi:NrtR DNA-binding winged helix domain-containing protein [Pontibacter sp. G13]|uniref:NUDIX hydrolase n=1 Tax=Pontibacter sp. G13 TaxID=3074898 RepID=UPI0028890ED7|nr:NUDIX domain-containing protein [Pontibacter sp. G13]WNJ19490.1 NUDIX domain-containing protein [Pontibacter sp. G13]